MSFSLKEYLELPKPEQVWIWHNLIPISGSALLYADPKQGKSKLALSLCEAIADPGKAGYLGLPVDTHGKVLYIQLDTPRYLWVDNYISCIEPGPSHDSLFMLDREMDTVPYPFDIRLQKTMDFVRKEVDLVEPLMVVVDVIRKTHHGDENDSSVAENVLNCWWNCTKPAAVLYLQHKRKPQTGDLPDGLVGPRGSTGFTGAVDMLLDLTKHRLRPLGRSPLDEDIPIYMTDNGTFALNSKAEEIAKFTETVAHLGATDQDKAIASRFNVSERTARRYRRPPQ